MEPKQIKPTLATIVAFRKKCKPTSSHTTHEMKIADWLDIQNAVIKVFSKKEITVVFNDGRAKVKIAL